MTVTERLTPARQWTSTPQFWDKASSRRGQSGDQHEVQANGLPEGPLRPLLCPPSQVALARFTWEPFPA